MGQKVNPIIFRQFLFKPVVSSWFSEFENYPSLISQDVEIRNFLRRLLSSRGIVLRSCSIFRLNNKLYVDVDLFFSYLLAKQSKFLWIKNFFKDLRKKYVNLTRLKDLRSFLDTFRFNENNFALLNTLSNNKTFYVGGNNSLIKGSLNFRTRGFFFLAINVKKKFLLKKKKKKSILSIVKRSFLPKIIRLRIPKLLALFRLKKFRLDFNKFWYKNACLRDLNSFSINLVDLSRSLCKSLQHFTGVEKIKLKIYSNQMSFLPSLKLYQTFIYKELLPFQRNKSLENCFVETLEILFFVVGTFSYGNAFLLSTYISFLLENNRKHVLIVKLIRKVLDIFFNKLPSNFLSISGIKILIKGRFNKRRRTKTLILQEGQISLQTLKIPLDYYHTCAVTLYGSFGIKVWISKK